MSYHTNFDKKNNEIVKSVYINIDSRDRNVNQYPNTNNYRIKLLNHKIKNIKKIELISAKIPKTNYIVNSTNNIIDFVENSVNYTITLTEGNYTLSTLSTEIQNELNGLLTANTYSVSIDSNTLKMTINRSSGTNSFSLLFASGSNADTIDSDGQVIKGSSSRILMGFNIADVTDTSGTITSQNLVNLQGENEIYIEINNFMGHIDTIKSDNNKLKGKIFAVIDMNVNSNEIKYFNHNEKKIEKEYFPYMNNLGFLDIKFKDYYGNLYDFRGNDNTLLLKVYYVEKLFI